MKNVTVLNIINVGSDTRKVRAKIKMNLRKERNNLIIKIPTNLTNLQNRKDDFAVSIQNRHAA